MLDSRAEAVAAQFVQRAVEEPKLIIEIGRAIVRVLERDAGARDELMLRPIQPDGNRPDGRRLQYRGRRRLGPVLQHHPVHIILKFLRRHIAHNEIFILSPIQLRKPRSFLKLLHISGM